MRFICGFVLLALAAAPLRAQSAGSTSLTIYNDGRVLVRRTVPVRVPAGQSTQAVAVGGIDPASIFSLDPQVAIERASYDGAVDEASVLRRAIGQRLVFRTGSRGGPNGAIIDDTVSAVVLGVDPLRLRMPDGRVAFSMPGQPLYPAELVITDPTAFLTLRSGSAREQLGLGYFGQGASWSAAYSVVLGAGGQARVSGQAVLGSQQLRADNADIQLLAGEVSSAPKAPMLQDMRVRREQAMAVAGNAASFDAAGEQKVGEFHLYSLPGRHSILPGQTSLVALFEPANAPYERNFVIRGEIPWWGYLPQHPEENDVPVEVSYTVRRPRGSALGDRPLPMGVARLFEADSAGRLQLVGEASLEHSPAGEDLRLNAGNAFDLTAKRVQTVYTTRRDSIRAGVWRTTVTAEYRVTVTNAADSAATVDVLEERRGTWQVVSSSVPAEKLSSTRTRFRVQVPARGETVLTYRVRITW